MLRFKIFYLRLLNNIAATLINHKNSIYNKLPEHEQNQYLLTFLR